MIQNKNFFFEFEYINFVLSVERGITKFALTPHNDRQKFTLSEIDLAFLSMRVPTSTILYAMGMLFVFFCPRDLSFKTPNFLSSSFSSTTWTSHTHCICPLTDIYIHDFFLFTFTFILTL